jgi:hypothetical protein
MYYLKDYSARTRSTEKIIKIATLIPYVCDTYSVCVRHLFRMCATLIPYVCDTYSVCRLELCIIIKNLASHGKLVWALDLVFGGSNFYFYRRRCDTYSV